MAFFNCQYLETETAVQTTTALMLRPFLSMMKTVGIKEQELPLHPSPQVAHFRVET